MRINDKKEKIEVLSKLPEFLKFHCVYANEKSKDKLRFTKESDNIIFRYGKGAKSRGYRYSLDQFADIYDIFIESEDEKDKKWHKQIARAIKCLEKSGLWSEKKIFLENLYKMTLKDKNALDSIYWSDLNRHNMSNNIQTKEYEPYIEKYPFAFTKTNDGIFKLDTNYTWELSDCKLKSMYFGKGSNSRIKEEILQSIKDKKSCTITQRTNYDVTFEYDADRNMAWYSEEYKDCGNGHYYLALDENTALFCEDD